MEQMFDTAATRRDTRQGMREHKRAAMRVRAWKTIKESAAPFARVEAMNPARILTPGFFAQLRPDLVRTRPGRQSVAGCGPQRGEVEVRNVRAAEGRPEGRLDRLVKLGVLHASGDQRDGYEIVGHRVGNDSTVDDRHAFGDLAQHEPQRNAQSGGNGLEQFGGRLLLPALNFGEIAQGHLCFGGDFAQGSTLALADATQDIAQFAAQQRSFAQCLSISLL